MRGKISGVFNIYTSESFFFNAAEIRLLNEVTKDIAFALEMVDAERKRKDAEDALRKSEILNRSLIEHLPQRIFLKDLNSSVYERFPGIQTYAEESTAWPMVSGPTDAGGLGFGFKWDMGWMHDTLGYLERDPVHRSHHHNQLTFRGVYLHAENYVLPLSHDEVVNGKGSLLQKMPGDRWQRFANLRLLYGYQWGQPGRSCSSRAASARSC